MSTKLNTTASVGGPVSGLLSAPALAELLDISVKGVRRLTDAGGVPGVVRLGRLVRYQRQAIEAWIADGCTTPPRSTARKGR